MLLEGKNVLVFAASGAIASAVGRRLAAEGATTWLSARNGAAVDELAGEIRAGGGAAHAEKLDATDPGAVADYVESVAAHAGGIDVVFNGIGGRPSDLGYPARSLEQPLEDFMIPLRRIVGSQFLTARAAARSMSENGGGSIVMLTAGLAAIGAPHMAGISAACAAVEATTRSLASELGPAGIRVNCVRGSAMPETRTIRDTADRLVALGAQPRIPAPPLGRPLTVAETAATVAFLASDLSSGMTGQVVVL